MISLALNGGSSRALNVLCLGCHSDDIEIGCGGTILRLAEQYPRSTFHWVVLSAIGVRKAEAQRAARMFVDSGNLRGLLLKGFRDGFMPFAGAEVKDVFEELKEKISPDVIFTHSRKDVHQDHRLVAELTWNTFRNHFILEYEIPKYDGDLGQPNVFVALEPDTYQKKIRYITQAFETQRSRSWFSEDTFKAIARLRGIECGAPSGLAEAFHG